jgi:hypothetical protein
MRTIALRADPPCRVAPRAGTPFHPQGRVSLGASRYQCLTFGETRGKEHERGRESGEIRTDVPLATLVESLLVLVGACVRTGTAAGMGVEDMSSTALRLFLTGARLAAD